jgi:hypothetical protein
MKPAGKTCEAWLRGRLSLWRCRVNPQNKGPANQDGASRGATNIGSPVNHNCSRSLAQEEMTVLDTLVGS